MAKLAEVLAEYPLQKLVSLISQRSNAPAEIFASITARLPVIGCETHDSPTREGYLFIEAPSEGPLVFTGVSHAQASLDFSAG